MIGVHHSSGEGHYVGADIQPAGKGSILGSIADRERAQVEAHRRAALSTPSDEYANYQGAGLAAAPRVPRLLESQISELAATHARTLDLAFRADQIASRIFGTLPEESGNAGELARDPNTHSERLASLTVEMNRTLTRLESSISRLEQFA